MGHRFFYPVADGDWIDADNFEQLSACGVLNLRGAEIALPAKALYWQVGVTLAEDRPAVFELCRFLGATHRDEVLASDAERRVKILPEMSPIMTLDEWHHPDLLAGETPSQTRTFQELARVLSYADPSLFSAPEAANNHWKNWPEGGTL